MTCLSEVPEKVNFMFQVACARRKCNAESDFSRSCVKFNDPLRSGLVAWALAMRFSFTCCVAGYCLVALYDSRPCDMLCSWQHPATMLHQQGLQFDRLLDLSIVRLRLSLSAHWEAPLRPMFPSCRSASAHGCWRRVLRTPPPLFF